MVNANSVMTSVRYTIAMNVHYGVLTVVLLALLQAACSAIYRSVPVSYKQKCQKFETAVRLRSRFWTFVCFHKDENSFIIEHAKSATKAS